jgi:hypothetical protein
MEDHKVVVDRGGWRLTCKEDACREATIVRHRWMTLEKWETDQRNFLAKHPCAEIEDLDQREK